MPEILEARRMHGDDEIARSLLAAVQEEFGPPARPDAGLVEPSDLSPPGGCFVALLDDGEPVAGGGVRALDGEVGEVKRMYVTPARRRGGLARLLLHELEEAARELGYTRLRLDTVGPLAPFYESAGYVRIPDYNGNPNTTFWGEKRL